MTMRSFDKTVIFASSKGPNPKKMEFLFTSDKIRLELDFYGTQRDVYLVKSIINRIKKYERVKTITLIICNDEENRVKEFFETVDLI